MPGIFISYRRDDSSGYAGRLRDRLIQRFGRNRVFLDIDDIPVGQDFVSVIRDRVASCSVVVVLIGNNWKRRLGDPKDFVRLEILTALERDIAIVPVLVAGGRMPSADELPSQIRRLAYLNAFELNDRFFDESIKRLTRTLAPYVGSALRRQVPGRAPLFATIAAMLLALVVILPRWLENPTPTRHAANKTERVAEPPKNRVSAPEIPRSPKVEDRTPRRITAPPPVVEAARNGSEFDDAPAVNGPKNPKILWQALFDRESMPHWSVAGDGTLLLCTGADAYHPALVAIREGREQWAYELKAQHPEAQLAPDGRVWVPGDSNDDRVLCFNTRGEGGRLEVTKSITEMMSERLSARGRLRGVYSGWQCERDKLSGTMSDGSPFRTLTLDGDCVSSTEDGRGHILAVTETSTIYNVGGTGQIRWTYKSDCKIRDIVPLKGDDAIVACESTYFSLRNGKKQWSRQGALATGPWRNRLLFDKSNTLYQRTGNSIIAINPDGEVMWSRELAYAAEPRLLDQNGRLYVGLGAESAGGPLFIACLGDR